MTDPAIDSKDDEKSDKFNLSAFPGLLRQLLDIPSRDDVMNLQHRLDELLERCETLAEKRQGKK